MGKPTVIASEDEIMVARIGTKIQAEAHGLDLTDEKIQKFVEHCAQVSAQSSAFNRFLSNIVNSRIKSD